jgi:hypothetical protein
VELRVEIRVAQWPPEAADSVFDMFGQHAAVLQRQLYGIVVAKLVVDGRLHFIRAARSWIAHHGVAVFLCRRRRI